MTPNTLDQPQILVLAPGPTPAAEANARGHLFEVFIAHLLHLYGYQKPTHANVNVTSDGIELDVSTTHRLSNSRAIAECKAYSRPVKASELTSFYGKLTVERFEHTSTLGLFVAVPRLSPPGQEKARSIAERDDQFICLTSHEIAERLEQEGTIAAAPRSIELSSDPVIVITPDGTYSAILELDPVQRIPTRVVCWAATGRVPEPTRELLEAHEYSQGLKVVDAFELTPATVASPATTSHILATVQGSEADFQYQLPASPRYFLGRKELTQDLATALDENETVFVLNARSGWGKSSLALKFADIVRNRGGHALVMDTRTASTPRYVVEVLKRAYDDAERNSLLAKPTVANWASLPTALDTFARAEWASPERPFLLFFDQFENVFKSEDLTRAFRDLVVGVREAKGSLVLGFAWKTDLVGWTESHPYQLRDEIRSSARVFLVEPFGSREVSTLIERLERNAGIKLVRDLRDRLREYSQGLPWLLKKLADHLLRELKNGVTQERLLSDALNVQSLFEADLAELDASQREILNYVARYAPIPASEVTERYNHQAVQSLVDRRLLVQIGDRIDTYWDIFRDYLTTGRIPVEDSYILRQTPNAVARLLPLVMQSGGSATVGELSAALATSDNVVFNLSRELRLLGVAAYEPLRVRLSDDVVQSTDPEATLRLKVANALRRHRAFSTLRELDERMDDGVDATHFAAALPSAFPAVSVTGNTWIAYARVFLGWFEYAGLVVRRGGMFSVAVEEQPARQLLLSSRPALRVNPAVPQEAFGPSGGLLSRLAAGERVILEPGNSSTRRAIRTLAALGAINVDVDGTVHTRVDGLVVDGRVDASKLLPLLEAAPGGSAGLALLRDHPDAHPLDVGRVIQTAIGARWSDEWIRSVGGYFRRWAQESGVAVKRAKRTSSIT